MPHAVVRLALEPPGPVYLAPRPARLGTFPNACASERVYAFLLVADGHSGWEDLEPVRIRRANCDEREGGRT